MNDQETDSEPQTSEVLLPNGGFIALRKSGGLRFTTRTIVVYADGRIETDRMGRRAVGRIDQAQIEELHRLLTKIDFPHLALPAIKPSPDAYVYEIAARIEREIHRVEVVDGHIPVPLKPLIDQLRRLTATIE
jgi:hypothetical protein